MQNLTQILASSKSILILLPTNPHFDQVASALALYKTLKQEGNHPETVIACPSPMLVEFNRLVGVDNITGELGNKNLVITFKDYPVDDLNTVSYEIVGGEIKIKVEPKPGVMAPKQEQIDLSYSGVAADTVILIGGAHDGHFPALSSPDLASTKLIHIGVRDINLQNKPLSLARQASSISEIVWKLLTDSNWNIDEDMATNLLMGVEDGSKNFTSPETNADTFTAMAELMKAGGKRVHKITQPDAKHFPPGAIPTKPYYPSKPVAQGVTHAPVRQSQVPEIEKQDPAVEVPKSWLGTPKVYKGSEGSN